MTGCTWIFFYHVKVNQTLQELESRVRFLKEKDPENYQKNFYAKHYARLLKAIRRVIEDPTLPEYRLGKTMGPDYRSWRRVKKDLQGRYRLFFRFFSMEHEIFFAWLNNEVTLRKAGAKTDVYAIFKKMLDRKDIPNTRESLIKASVKKDADKDL